ncbi:MAG: hypothetical protein V3V08_12805, partial [Nannocystaceae bacterium]
IIEPSPHTELDIDPLAFFDAKAGCCRCANHSDATATPKRIAWWPLMFSDEEQARKMQRYPVTRDLPNAGLLGILTTTRRDL